MLFLDPPMPPKPHNDLVVPFESNRTFGLCEEGGDGGSFEFEWNDAKKQVLIHGDKINPVFMKQALERPIFGPYHRIIPALSPNPLFIEPDYTVFAEIRGQFFRVDRAGGEVVLVALDPKGSQT